MIPESWKTVSLSSISTVNGKYGANASACEFDKDKPRYIRITDIDDNGLLIPEGKVGAKIDNLNEFIVEKNDLLFVRTGSTTGKCYLHQESKGCYIFAGFLVKFQINKNKAIPYYIWTLTKGNSYKKWIQIMSVRSGQPGINGKEFGEYKINLPPLPEQKKIAEILSTWDEAIELTQKKYSNLLLLKKGVAQKIINSPEWKKVPIRSLLKKKSVMSVPNSNQYLEIGDVDISTKKYTLKEKPPVKGAVLAPKGSILISTVRPTRGAITMISDNLLVSSAFVIVDLLPTISKTFIFSQLNSEKFLNNMGRLSTGSTYPTVNREDVLSYKVLVPPIEEQDSISEVMDNLTKSLSLLENKINLLKLQKQGLMQRLLTGKVRVKLD